MLRRRQRCDREDATQRQYHNYHGSFHGNLPPVSNVLAGVRPPAIHKMLQKEAIDKVFLSPGTEKFCPELNGGEYKLWTFAEAPVILLSLCSGWVLGWQGFFWAGAIRLMDAAENQIYEALERIKSYDARCIGDEIRERVDVIKIKPTIPGVH